MASRRLVKVGLLGSLGSLLVIGLAAYVDNNVENPPSWLGGLSIAVIVFFAIAALLSVIVLIVGILAD